MTCQSSKTKSPTKYRSTWVESGTGYREWSDVYDTIEEAMSATNGKLYPPIRATIQVLEVLDS